MDKDRKNIIVLEPSRVLFEGISSSIAKLEHDFSFFYLSDLVEVEILKLHKDISVILINPLVIQNRHHDFVKIKKLFPDIHWIGIVYCFFDFSLLKNFDDSFLITDDVSIILKKINKVCRSNNLGHIPPKNEDLSEREKVVLMWLSKGLSNKEIADKLNISIHTVNSHRRNIMDKTGIRSLSGLTIYAVSKGIISID